jgi:integrase/recombinase XerD
MFIKVWYPPKKNNMKTTIKHFSNYLIRIGYSEKNQIMLPNLITNFFNYTNKPLADIDKNDILNYHKHLQIRDTTKLSQISIARHIYALNVFFSYQLAQGNIAQNPMYTLVFARSSSKPIQILTQEEITTLFNACETHRERIVLNLCYNLGLRPSEAINLEMKDINLQTAQAAIYQENTKKWRIIPINDTALETFKTYLEKERVSNSSPVLFTTIKGDRTTANNINQTLKKILKRTNVPQKTTLHTLRHSIATHLLENGAALDTVSDFLGHKHLEFTQIYSRVGHKRNYDLMIN